MRRETFSRPLAPAPRPLSPSGLPDQRPPIGDAVPSMVFQQTRGSRRHTFGLARAGFLLASVVALVVGMGGVAQAHYVYGLRGPLK